MTPICAVHDCEKGSIARGWCGAHYRRWNKYGDPEGVAQRKAKPATGNLRRCGACKRTLDVAEFPNGWTPCRDCRKDRHFSQGRKCSVCDSPISNSSTSGLCRTDFNTSRRYDTTPKRLRVAGGYVALTGHWDHPNARLRGHILEHVKVMSEMLGRPLAPGENVHHKNGVRDDNRPENLELWVVSQPKGQRPDDLVAWAMEILERYGARESSAA